MNLNQISRKMEQTFAKEGVANIEVTFCRADMFSIAALDEASLTAARAVLAKVSNARLDDIEIDDECGAFAYYRF
jgi:hypothetical protein